MNDEAIPVAYAMHVSPRRYALFLGSGISKPAGLPTGTDVSANMIRRIAKTRGEKIDGGNEPEKCLEWFKDTFGEPANFELLLNKLGIDTENRSEGIQSFFLPSDETGNPVQVNPTKAHSEIAKFVKAGMVSMIITTNYDTLLEEALRNEGVSCDVITSESPLKQMSIFPDRCRIVKVNGSFSSGGRLKITPKDLESYEPDMEDYLKRIFAEYGIIVCGWSAQFDTGLKKILANLEVRRYPVFWCKKNSEIPQKLSESLNPIEIEIESADQFFNDLSAVLDRLKVVEERQPLTIPIAVRKITNALQQPRPEILISDILYSETDLVIDELSNSDFIPDDNSSERDVSIQRVEALERKTKPLAAMMATVAYYDNEKLTEQVFDVIQILINPPYERISNIPSQFRNRLYYLQYIPALLVIYATGIAATKAMHFNMLEAVFTPRRSPTHDPYLHYVNTRQILGHENFFTDLNYSKFGRNGELSTYPCEVTKRIIRHLIPGDLRYSEYYDIFEYLFGLAYLREEKMGVSQEGPNEFSRGKYPALESRFCKRTYRIGVGFNIPGYIHSYFRDVERKISKENSSIGDPTWIAEYSWQYGQMFHIDNPPSLPSYKGL